ncbi:hypothetical protein GQ457_03G008910 [Hibiscus cannabinus]
MQSNDFVTDLPMLNISDDKCDSCQLGKSHKLSFSLDGVKRANMKLELVHSDLCGPMKTSSMNGSKYFVLFIDDLTRMCWVYFLKSKLNVLSSFKEFKIFVENQSDCKLKVLRTDNGGEYVSNEFNDFCSERRNRTVLEMARCMLFEKHLPKLFWAEAVANTVYLLNMLETKAVNGRTPLKACSTIIITEDVENGETSDWFDVAGTTDADEVIKTKSLASVYERCNLVFAEPISFDAAAKVPEWIDAMKSEIFAIEKNGTWFLTDLSSGKHVICVKWVYRTKFNLDGSIFKQKAILVVKGYAQICGVDYGDTFAPVARLDTIRLLIAISGQLGKEHQVHKFKRALYGLKQASRAWYYKIDSYLQKLGFQRSVNEATLYLKKDKNAYLLVISLYVDDLLVMESNDKAVSEFKLSMQKEFKMYDLGLMSYFLWIEINQCMAGIFVSQNKYALDVLRQLKLESCKGVDSPLPSNLKLSKNDGEKLCDPSIFRSIVGSLLYIIATLLMY